MNKLTISVFAPTVGADRYVAITGNQTCMGNWDAGKALKMSDKRFPVWSISLDISDITLPFEYKFVVKSGATDNLVYWEEGANRTLQQSDFLRREAPERRWKAAGVAVPLFSLRSEESFGIGDVGDLKELIDWAANNELQVVQLLPVNDTCRTHTWRDSYPYSAISVFALHPLYISIQMLYGKLNNPDSEAKYEKIRKELNALKQVDYPAVEKAKSAYLREYYAQEKENLMENIDFSVFIADNADWLVPYAAFSYLRDKYGTADFGKWGEYSIYNEDTIKRLCKPDGEAYEEAIYTCFLQYTLDCQFKAVSLYARCKHILLKGDVPIGVNRESVDAWTNPQYFNMQQQSGAPPDDFSETGQNWSFPTYNWDAIEQDGFVWWKRRLQHLNRYFSCIRIDHILGFFRIWEIPLEANNEAGTEGLLGHFRPALPLSKEEIASWGLRWEDVEPLFVSDPYQPARFHPLISGSKTEAYRQLPQERREAFDRLHDDFFYRRHNDFWKETALKRLRPLTEHADMLVCGEDLGMLPATVHEVMNRLNILSLELGRISKQFGKEFTDIPSLPYMSVCTTSTHDMNPIRAWWGEDRQRTQRYYNNVLHREGKPPQVCTPDIARQIVRQHLTAPSMLTVIPLQDFLATSEATCIDVPEAERINVPANPEHYWRYRMPLNIEQLDSLTVAPLPKA